MTVRAGQWNVGLEGAPPPETAAPVPGDASLLLVRALVHDTSSYQLAVAIDGPAGHGAVVIPVLALATAERPMPPWLGGVLAALGIFLTAGLLTIVGSAVRESGLPPGAQPDASAASARDSASQSPACSPRWRCGAATNGGRRRRRATAGRCSTARSTPSRRWRAHDAIAGR